MPGGVRNCDEHKSRWDSSTRRRPRGWAKIRARILRRDQWICYVCGLRATDVDHINNLGGDDDWNLAAICLRCHKRKTQAEARESRLKNG